MKINDPNLSGAAAAETHRSQETQQTGRTGSGRSSGSGADSGDRVELSGNLGRLSRALSSFRSDRATQVQSLTAQYQTGSYRPDSAATSRGMVSEALDAGSQ